ncbi:MAG: DNA-processing protein DprA [Magnetovibrio sp.]|nr:DNA-processing protein DprA [Magnetovibrio sp.]
MQRLSAETRAILLLCGHFGTTAADGKPLTPAEYHRFADWLAARQLSLGGLLGGGLSGALGEVRGINIAAARLATLLGRQGDLERALDGWARAGIWVLSLADAEFPARLGARLKSAVSPLVFGAGPRRRLGRGGVCIIGSRDSHEAGLEFARRLGRRAGAAAMTVISSDMRGVDREAISSTLAAGGNVVSVLSDSLVKAAAAKRNRDALADGTMTLVTPFSPDTRFTVANAMRANKYQYALSDVAVIVETRRKGGIWSGAEENRAEGWVPAFVRSGDHMSPGNLALLHLGYQPIGLDDVETCDDLMAFFLAKREEAAAGVPTRAGRPDFYAAFIAELNAVAASPVSAETIAEHFGIEAAQARSWLARANQEGRVRKLGDPERYVAGPA